MANFKTALAMENEIFKATDFNFGYDSIIANIATAMKAVLSGSEGNYVIGGKVKPYGSGGLNVSIEPIYGFCNSTGVCVAESDTTEPVSFEEADSSLDRIDIIEICGTETGYDSQSRKFIDPSTGTETTQTVNTKKKIALSVVVKKGSNGSESAPAVDSGYVKIAEVRIPAGTNNITEDLIKNIDARKYGVNNTDWTTNKAATFNPSYLANIFHTFLENHNEDGSHKSAVIKAANIDFGTGAAQVKGSSMPTGQSMSVHGLDFTSTQSVTDLIVALANNTNNLYKYSNDILSRFSFADNLPVACSTANVDIATGGEMTIDGVSCTIGQLVFLKDQTDAKENGFYEVQSGAWNRYAGYTTSVPAAFRHKLVFVKAGTANKGKVFYLNGDFEQIGTDELNFVESKISPFAKANTFIVRDENGRAKVAAPKDTDDIARYYEVLREIARNSGTNGVGFPFGKERFMTFDFTDENHKSIKIKKDVHIRLDITDVGNTERRWFDVDTDTVFDLSEGMQTAADASSTRTGQLNGRDFYIYLVPDGIGVKLVVSCNSTYPNDISADYNANNTRKIGQFTTLCADAGDSLEGKIAAAPGTEVAGDNYLLKQYNPDDEDGFYDFYNKPISSVKTNTQYDVLTVAHPLAGFTAGDLLPESVFCLSFRPYSEGAGMVYDIDTDIAADVYLQSGKGKLTASIFGGTTTDTRPQQNHQDDMRQVRKRLLFDNEFASIASGSNEGTNITGSADPVTTGGHVDTASRRMISFIGCEDCCGALWQWSEDVGPIGGSDPSVYDGNGAFGKTYGTCFGLLLGGGWATAAHCGSRGCDATNSRSHADDYISGRGASRLVRRT
jgi:hypothetical protein